MDWDVRAGHAVSQAYRTTTCCEDSAKPRQSAILGAPRSPEGSTRGRLAYEARGRFPRAIRLRSMPEIFMSYRRADAAATAGRLFDRLAEHFGPDHG